ATLAQAGRRLGGQGHAGASSLSVAYTANITSHAGNRQTVPHDRPALRLPVFPAPPLRAGSMLRRRSRNRLVLLIFCRRSCPSRFLTPHTASEVIDAPLFSSSPDSFLTPPRRICCGGARAGERPCRRGADAAQAGRGGRAQGR